MTYFAKGAASMALAAALASCGQSVNTEQVTPAHTFTPASTTELASVPAKVIVRVPLDANGQTVAQQAEIREVRSAVSIQSADGAAAAFENAATPQATRELDQDSSTQSWYGYNNGYYGNYYTGWGWSRPWYGYGYSYFNYSPFYCFNNSYYVYSRPTYYVVRTRPVTYYQTTISGPYYGYAYYSYDRSGYRTDDYTAAAAPGQNGYDNGYNNGYKPAEPAYPSQNPGQYPYPSQDPNQQQNPDQQYPNQTN